MRRAKKTNLFVAVIAAVLLVSVLLVVFLFNNFIRNYQVSIADESADHLVEINEQIRLYIEEKLDNDWQVTRSLANSISVYEQKTPEALFALVARERDIWDSSDIFLYNADGFCMSANGEIIANDKASENVYLARQYGEFMDIMESTVIFTMAFDSDIQFMGSPIVAISVVHQLDSFLDNIGFSSFGGEAFICLTAENGAIISELTHARATGVYNILSYLEAQTLRCLSHEQHAVRDMLQNSDHCTFLMTGENGEEAQYVVATKIVSLGGSLRLFYFVPESIVNSTMNGFSRYVTTLSVTIICVFSLCGGLAFIFVYSVRKRSFDNALSARDRMFDMLVSNTRNAFALLSAGQKEPLYISSNAKSIIGDDYLWLEKLDRGYRMQTPSEIETEATRSINKDLALWNGKSEFASAYAPYLLGGITRYFVMRVYPVGENEDEFVAIAQDVTSERQREEALRDALAMADSANVAKTRFLTNMSHDIRTPMNAIINMTDFAIESAGDAARQREYLKTIRDSSDHLLRLINDILDMSRIESGQVAMALAPFDLLECLDDLRDMITPLAREKRQAFTQDHSAVKTVKIVGDKVKLSRVLLNLLNNAVKFTPEGGSVRFTALEMPSLRGDTAAFRFTVQDSGYGIPARDIVHIFDPFTRADNEQTRAAEGSGLGLSICKSYVTAMGGTIACESILGEGSVFTVEVFFEKGHIKPEPPPARAEAPGEVFAGKRALLCEDNPVNQTIARMILQKLGFAVDIAPDGREAARMFKASEPGAYDVVYMDIQMPIMTGYEATLAIRTCGHPGSASVPIIAMTANVFAEDVEKARASGMDGHIAKPIVVEELVEATRAAILRAKARTAGA